MKIIKKKIDIDKRKMQRLSSSIKVKYKLLLKRKIIEETFCQNVSGGGIGLRLSQPLNKGTKIKILLNFPGDSKPITAISEVVWCRKTKTSKKPFYYDVGVKYTRIMPKDKERFIFLFCEMMLNVFIEGRI